MSVYESNAGPVELDEPETRLQPATDAQKYGQRVYVGYDEYGDGAAFSWAGRMF